MQGISSNLSRVKACLKKAGHEKTRAENLMKIWDWNGSVEASQCSIRHSVESLFWLVGEEYDSSGLAAKFDVVIGKLLEMYNFGLYYRDKLLRMRWIVNVWANIREDSIYAYEQDAKVLKDYADEVYGICSHIVSLVKSYADRMAIDSYLGDDGLP
ncbi:MAG: hypothetical protein ACE5NN_07135 [Candidatus Bathyarchaeia archaeon]